MNAGGDGTGAKKRAHNKERAGYRGYNTVTARSRKGGSMNEEGDSTVAKKRSMKAEGDGSGAKKAGA